jgi:proteic killer suppression protein
MEVTFAAPELEKLERNPAARSALDHKLVRSFRKVMNLIRTASDPRDLYAWKHLHYEKLKGDREGQHSFRLHGKWRLIVELRDASPAQVVHVVGIQDYH